MQNLNNNYYIIFSLILDKKYLLSKSITLYEYIHISEISKEINLIFKMNLQKFIHIEMLDEIILFSGIDINYISKYLYDKKTLFCNLDYLGNELFTSYYNKNILNKNYYSQYINALSQDKFYPLNKYIYKDYKLYKSLKKTIYSSKNLQIALNNAEPPKTTINNILNNTNYYDYFT